MADSTFRVGGLASGLDTNSIVDKLVAIEARSITVNSQRQSALSVQISAIGDLISKIKALASSASTLAKSGVSATSIASTPSGITAATGTGALPGSYGIVVESVATAAKARSTGFGTTNDTVAGGVLALNVKGTAHNITITAGSDLGSVVSQINQAGAPVSAALISNGSQFFVSLTNRETGKPIGSAADGGLIVSSDATGLGMAVTQNAANAKVTIDNDLLVESQSNEITTAIPGVTLTVKAQQLVPADLVIGRDNSKSGGSVQGFVDTYNSIMAVLKKSLRPDPEAGANAGNKLNGSVVLDLQRRMHNLLSTKVVATGTFRTLADIGVKLKNDGSLELEQAKLSAALAKDATAVDAVFSTAATGLGAQTDALAKTYTDVIDGQLIQRQTSLQKTIKDLATSGTKLQSHVEHFKQQLIQRFAQMESLIGNYNTIGSFISSSPILNPTKSK